MLLMDVDPRTPSSASSNSFRVPKSSPLDSLVRRASSRRARSKDPPQDPRTPPRNAPNDQQQQQSWHQPPVSPLLHTEFRTSVASTSISVYDGRSMVSETTGLQAEGYDPHP